MADYDKAYNKALFADGAGAGDSPSWMPGGVYGGVPMGGGSYKKHRKSKLRKFKKSKKMYKKGGNKKLKRTMRKMKKYSKKH